MDRIRNPSGGFVVALFALCLIATGVFIGQPVAPAQEARPFEIERDGELIRIEQEGYRTIVARRQTITDAVVYPPNVGPNMLPFWTVNISVGPAKYRLDCVDEEHADRFIDAVFELDR